VQQITPAGDGFDKLEASDRQLTYFLALKR